MLEQGDRLASLGKYKLIASLAEGGMAKVYLGLMAGPAGVNKLLVIKVLKKQEEEGTQDEDVQLFWDEARLAARVIHPNIVQTYEVGEADGRYFLAMEYLDGQSYRAFHTRLAGTSLPLSEDLRVIAEVARGLHYAHELTDFKGEPLHVVHRDVSPQNIFITYEGQVKLLDFGIAKSQDHGHKTRVGVIKGKLDYIAPEQLSGDDVDARADIFALGVLLWEAVTRERFAGGRGIPEVKKIHTRLTGGEPKIRDKKPDVPEALACIIEKALAVAPEGRYESAGQLADAIDAFIESTGERPSAKNLSELMQKLFGEDRRKMHQLIDQQIEAARDRTGDLSRSLPQLSLSSTMTPTARGLDQSQSQSVAIPVPAPPARKGPSAAILVGCMAGAVGLAVWLSTRPDDSASQAVAGAPVTEVHEARPPTKDPEPQPASPSTGKSTVSDAARSVTIRLSASPADAQATLDGAEIPLPFTGTFQKSSDLHRLEVFAKGYQSHKRFIDFTQDLSVEVDLSHASSRSARRGASNDDKEPVAARETEPVAPPSPAPPRGLAPGEDLGNTKKPKVARDIDTDNPYAKPR